jgi:CDP-2,3-bis-(O-geranylgeranyl)-sn-glycerol synthase
VTLWLLALAGAVWALLPAFVANALAPLSRGKGPKMDFGRTLKRDGRPVLGSSKTWAGFFIGGFLGLLVGIFEDFLYLAAPPSLQIIPSFGSTLMLAIPPVALLSFGALAGDALGSFIKRRIGVPSGGSAPLLDQLPFVLLPMLLLGLAYPSIFLASFWPGLMVGSLVIAWAVLLTLFLHTSFNWIGYFLRVKKVPW